MLVSLTGNNEYGVKNRLNELVETFKNEHGEYAVVKIDAEESEVDSILSQLQHMPLFTNERLVVLKNLSKNPPAAESVEQIISSSSKDNSIVFYEPNIDKRTSYYKTLKKATKLEEINQLEGPKLARWLVDEASKRGGKMDYKQALYLIERVGTNQHLLSNELSKLITYNSEITNQTIDLLTEQTPQSRIFDLLDAAFNHKVDKALSYYEEQRSQRVEPQAILAMLAWQLNILVTVKLGNGKDPSQIAKDFSISPYPITKAKNIMANISDDKIEQLIVDLLDIDVKSKTKTIDLDEALKTYIATI
jgi:DNA polymerase-3 subunit delta